MLLCKCGVGEDCARDWGGVWIVHCGSIVMWCEIRGCGGDVNKKSGYGGEWAFFISFLNISNVPLTAYMACV